MNNIDPYNNAPPPRSGGSCSGGSCSKPPSLQQAPPTRSIPQYTNKLSEVEMLKSDLQTAISYIYKLGGTWPPPGY